MLLRDTDVMSMAHPLEIRIPFMDHRLVEMMLKKRMPLHRPKKKQTKREVRLMLGCGVI